MKDEIQKQMNEGWIPVLRVGTFIDSAGRTQIFDEPRLQRIADNYHPEQKEIPLIIGHEFADNTEAKGWIAGLKRTGNMLLAKPKELAGDLVEKLKTKAFKYVSISIKNDDTPRHLAVVSSPAVTGLGPIPAAVYANFAEGETEKDIIHLSFDFAELDADAVSSKFVDIGTLIRKLREFFIETDGIEKIDQVIPEYMIKFISEYPVIKPEVNEPALTNFTENKQEVNMKDLPGQPGQTTQVAEPAVDLAAELQKEKTRSAAAEQKLAAIEKGNREKAAIDFADALMKKGILYPNQKNAFQAVMMKLHEVNETSINFSDAAGATVSMPVVDAFKGIFEGIKPTLPLTPLSDLKKGKGGGNVDSLTAEFSDAKGVAENELELHHKALAISKEKNIPYEAALRMAGGE